VYQIGRPGGAAWRVTVKDGGDGLSADAVQCSHKDCEWRKRQTSVKNITTCVQARVRGQRRAATERMPNKKREPRRRLRVLQRQVARICSRMPLPLPNCYSPMLGLLPVPSGSKRSTIEIGGQPSRTADCSALPWNPNMSTIDTRLAKWTELYGLLREARAHLISATNAGESGTHLADLALEVERLRRESDAALIAVQIEFEFMQTQKRAPARAENRNWSLQW
jgi:hypothetical protein